MLLTKHKRILLQTHTTDRQAAMKLQHVPAPFHRALCAGNEQRCLGISDLERDLPYQASLSWYQWLLDLASPARHERR
jgi:hypothetical protein